MSTFDQNPNRNLLDRDIASGEKRAVGNETREIANADVDLSSLSHPGLAVSAGEGFESKVLGTAGRAALNKEQVSGAIRGRFAHLDESQIQVLEDNVRALVDRAAVASSTSRTFSVDKPPPQPGEQVNENGEVIAGAQMDPQADPLKQANPIQQADGVTQANPLAQGEQNGIGLAQGEQLGQAAGLSEPLATREALANGLEQGQSWEAAIGVTQSDSLSVGLSQGQDLRMSTAFTISDSMDVANELGVTETQPIADVSGLYELGGMTFGDRSSFVQSEVTATGIDSPEPLVVTGQGELLELDREGLSAHPSEQVETEAARREREAREFAERLAAIKAQYGNENWLAASTEAQLPPKTEKQPEAAPAVSPFSLSSPVAGPDQNPSYVLPDTAQDPWSFESAHGTDSFSFSGTDFRADFRGKNAA